MQNWIFDIRSRSFVLLVILFVIVSMLVYFQITEGFDQLIISSVADNVGNPTIDGCDLCALGNESNTQRSNNFDNLLTMIVFAASCGVNS